MYMNLMVTCFMLFTGTDKFIKATAAIKTGGHLRCRRRVSRKMDNSTKVIIDIFH